MISINFDIPKEAIESNDVKELVKFTYKYLKLEQEPRVSISFCDIQTIKRYNHKYRSVNSPTDVLSFQDPDNEFNEIYICSEIVKINSSEFGSDYREELIRTIVHGLLHILGYDHKKALNDNEDMFIVQEQIVGSFINDEQN